MGAFGAPLTAHSFLRLTMMFASVVVTFTSSFKAMSELFIRARRDGGFEKSDWIKFSAIVLIGFAMKDASWGFTAPMLPLRVGGWGSFFRGLP